MCIIAVKPANIPLPTDKFIDDNWVENPDGAGIMFIKHGAKEVTMIKGFMEKKDLINSIKENNLTEDDLLIIHFRWATSGKKNAPATHPFIIDKDKSISYSTTFVSEHDLFFAHNGVISALNNNHDESDTQIFATQFLPHISVKDIYNNDVIRQMISKFIDGSRLVFLHAKYGVTLIGTWHDYNGLKLSKMYCERQDYFNNIDWRNYSQSFYAPSKKKKKKNKFTFERDDYDSEYNSESKIKYEWYCESCSNIIDEDTIQYNQDYDCYLCFDCNKSLDFEDKQFNETPF